MVSGSSYLVVQGRTTLCDNELDIWTKKFNLEIKILSDSSKDAAYLQFYKKYSSSRALSLQPSEFFRNLENLLAGLGYRAFKPRAFIVILTGCAFTHIFFIVILTGCAFTHIFLIVILTGCAFTHIFLELGKRRRLTKINCR